VIYSGNGLSATRNLAATAGANLTRNQSGTLNGLYAQLGYSGFTAAYGVFNLEQAGVNSTVNSFKLGYNVRF